MSIDGGRFQSIICFSNLSDWFLESCHIVWTPDILDKKKKGPISTKTWGTDTQVMHMKLQKPPAYDSDESDDDGWDIRCPENWDRDIDRVDRVDLVDRFLSIQ